MISLLTTLVHEVNMHGKVEFILPKFNNWLQKHSNLAARKIKHSSAYIIVCYELTKKDYFIHIVNSVAYYCKIQSIDITKYNLTRRTYRKLSSFIN